MIFSFRYRTLRYSWTRNRKNEEMEDVNITLQEFHYTSIRNVKKIDRFAYERNTKAAVIQDSRNPNNFLYLSESDE